MTIQHTFPVPVPVAPTASRRASQRPSRRVSARAPWRAPWLLATLLATPLAAYAQSSAPGPATLTPVQQQFHAIYQELVEINTTHSAGDTTAAARAMAKRLVDAGFTESEFEIVEPFPKKGNLVLRWKGSGARGPVLLLAHIDVVEAKREDWKTDPFVLQESDGYFTARGSYDDKAMASALVSVLGQLRSEGWMPNRDVILALTADEERGDVDSNGVKWMTQNRPELLKAEVGINEGGGGELRGGKPVLHRLQVAEKMYTSYTAEVRDVGGHSSLPTATNPIYAMAAGLDRLGKYQFPVQLADVTQTYFGRSAPLIGGQVGEDMKAVASGSPSPGAIERLSASPLYNALLRTTCVATMVNAGHAENALPQSAKATINCRILPHDDPNDVDRQLREVLGDKITLTQLLPPTRSPASPLDNEVVKAAEALTAQMWPGVPVIPSMSTGATDSRFLRAAGLSVYGTSGLFADPADLRAHGLDERIEIGRLYDGREYLYRLIKAVTQ